MSEEKVIHPTPEETAEAILQQEKLKQLIESVGSKGAQEAQNALVGLQGAIQSALNKEHQTRLTSSLEVETDEKVALDLLGELPLANSYQLIAVAVNVIKAKAIEKLNETKVSDLGVSV